MDLAPLLAQLPQSTVYVNPLKLLTIGVLVALWALYAQWVDKDTLRVNTYRIIWNMVTLFTGVIALALLLFLPEFWAGVAAFAVIQGALTAIYVVHRNGLVEAEDRVCTPQHIQRLMREGFSKGRKGKEKVSVQQRVRLTTTSKQVVAIPDDDIQREQYRLLQEYLFDALLRRATLLDVTPAGQASRITYHVDGVPAERDPLPRAEADALVHYVKQIAGLTPGGRRKPQRGKLLGSMGEQRYEFAIITNGPTAGERLTLRVIGAERTFKLPDIGLTEEQVSQLREVMAADHGLVLISAPPRNGLSTTAYTFARSHDAFLENIQMLEYEREIDVENISQHTFVPGDDRTFAGEFQKITRTDPDVIVVPELRDKAAATLACQAADKQLVYVAFQATDLWDGVRRFMATVADPKLIARNLLAVMHQRLPRLLCTPCRRAYKPAASELRKLNLPADKVLYRPPEPQYDKHGNLIICQACGGTGYMGRTGVFHLMIVDDGLRGVIRGGGTLADMQAYALKQGAPGLQQAALQKVFDGLTSIDEVVRVTRPPQQGAPRAATAQPADGNAAGQPAR